MAIRGGFRARNRVRAIKLPSGVLCYMRNLRPTILGYIEVRFSCEILFFRYFGPKKHDLGLFRARKVVFIPSQCFVTLLNHLPYQYHDIIWNGLCDDMLLPYVVIFDHNRGPARFRADPGQQHQYHFVS